MPDLDTQPKPILPDVRATWRWDLDRLQAWQLEQLNRQLAAVLPANAFYADKFGDALQLKHLDEIADLPMTTKQQLVDSAQSASKENGISRHHTFDQREYSRVHRTSGTTGRPMLVLDTTDDWKWWSSTWQHVLEAAEVTSLDRVFLAFSFGPFVGFWSAHQACVDRGATVIPGGGLSSLARLEFMRQARATVICCTPSYALHLAEVASRERFELRDLEIRRMIVAGEPGGSIPAVRSRIEQDWNAQVVDHSGATEIGPWGFGWPDQPGLHVAETSFIAELIPLESASSSSDEERGDEHADLRELVLTSLGRYGAPVFRYRTGDVVRAQQSRDGRCRFLWLPGGVLGRTDSMLIVRGVNIFPSSIDAIVRDFADVAEYRVLVTRQGQLDQLQLEVETNSTTRSELEKAFSVRLGLRVPVRIVPPASLPRSEAKSRRWQDMRTEP